MIAITRIIRRFTLLVLFASTLLLVGCSTPTAGDADMQPVAAANIATIV